MASKSDYYERLDVSPDVGAEELKKAYRKAALRYHPDRNPGDKAAEEKFKELSEAYQVLNDPEKRARYDRFGQAAFEQGGGGFSGGADFSTNFEDIFGDIFGDFFGGGSRGGRGVSSVARISVIVSRSPSKRPRSVRKRRLLFHAGRRVRPVMGLVRNQARGHRRVAHVAGVARCVFNKAFLRWPERATSVVVRDQW